MSSSTIPSAKSQDKEDVLANDIYEALTQAKDNLGSLQDKIKDKHVIVVVGNTKSGKSTLINKLIGIELEAYYCVEEDKCKIKKVDENTDGPHIGQELDSDTAIPGIYEWKGFTVIDTPGFDDNREDAQGVINALYTNQIRYSTTCKFVLVCDINDVTGDNVGQFLKSVADMNKLIENADHNTEVALILTKALSYHSNKKITERLRRITSNAKINLSNRDKKLINSFADNEELVAFFRMPICEGKLKSEIGVTICTAISKSTQSCTLDYKIGFVFKDSVRLALYKICYKFINNFQIESEMRKLCTEYEKFDDFEYRSASTDEELNQIKAALINLRSKLEFRDNTLQNMLLTINQLINNSNDFYKTLVLFIMLDEIKLMDQELKKSLIGKFKESLKNIDNFLGKIKAKMSKEEKSREDASKKKVFRATVGSIAAGVGGGALYVGEVVAATTLIGLATTVTGVVLLGVGIGTTATVFVRNVFEKREMHKKRTEQRR